MVPLNFLLGDASTTNVVAIPALKNPVVAAQTRCLDPVHDAVVIRYTTTNGGG